jgi:hypothetical protein
VIKTDYLAIAVSTPFAKKLHYLNHIEMLEYCFYFFQPSAVTGINLDSPELY